MNIHPVTYRITKEMHNKRNKHKSAVLWFTGLSASGKTTIANALEAKLFEMGHQTFSLDGDNIRAGLNKDLDFSDAGRVENIRRISEVAKLMADSGHIVTTAFISPFIADREVARKIIGEDFIEIYCNASFETCANRDPKGLYKKALNNEIRNFTGLDSPYEAPTDPEIILNTDVDSFNIDDLIAVILWLLKKRNILIDPYVNKLIKGRTLAIDFDGVIHKYSKGFNGTEDAYDEPMEGCIEALKELRGRGIILKIMSSRPAHIIHQWLDKYNMNNLIDEVTNEKIPAALYIDDRAYHFTTWESAMVDIFNHPKFKDTDEGK